MGVLRQAPESGGGEAGSPLTLRLAALLPLLCLALYPASAAGQEAFTIEPLPKTDKELKDRFTAGQLDLLEKLNRRDREHLVRTDPPVPGLVVPVAWQDDELSYSPLPKEWPAAAGHSKYVVVHQPFQVFGAYESGRLVRWGPISSGRKETPTPAGAYNLTWRSRKRTSTDNDAWILEWYFNFINSRGISFHQFDLPGYAASHACVRMLQRDAQWLYGWGDQWKLSEDRRTVDVPGTPVLVIGAFGHGQAGPWTSLPMLTTALPLPEAVAPPASSVR